MKKNLKTITLWLCMAALFLSLTACGSSVPVTTAAESQSSRETLPDKTEGSTEAMTTEAAGEASSEQTTAEPTTEETEPATTEPPTEPAAGDPDELRERRINAFTKYQHLLAEHLDSIEFQNYFTIFDPNGDPERPMQVVLADIHGDEIPEIIFVEHVENEQGIEVQSLKIFTYYGETIEMLYEATVDIAAGNGMQFCLFQNGEDKEPWLQILSGEEGVERKSVYRIRYERKDDGTYAWTGTRFYCVEAGEDADPAVREEWMFCDDKQCENLEKDTFYARLEPILTDTHPLIHNFSDNNLPEDLAGKPMQAMTYDEAMAQLEEWIDAEDETLEPGGMTSELFETIQGEYFQHGGDWTTWLTVYADGSFYGEYSAHYIQDEKRHYDVGEFHGHFTDPQQIDDLTWTIRVESVTVDGTIGEEWTEGEETFTRIGDPTTPVEGATLTVFLQGSDSSRIPEEFFMWIRSSADLMPKLEQPALIDEDDTTYYYLNREE